MEKKIIGKNAQTGIAPAIALCNPKYPHNVGAAIRAASCFGIKQVYYSGDRIQIKEGERIPREERMKGYKEVELIQYDYFFDQFPKGVTPVAIEIKPGSEMLPTFEHPENPLYVFGPEDGSIPSTVLRHCHRLVTIPTYHCTNLSAAVYIVLYDRAMKRQLAGIDPIMTSDGMLKEHRGWMEPDYELVG